MIGIHFQCEQMTQLNLCVCTSSLRAYRFISYILSNPSFIIGPSLMARISGWTLRLSSSHYICQLGLGLLVSVLLYLYCCALWIGSVGVKWFDSVVGGERSFVVVQIIFKSPVGKVSLPAQPSREYSISNLDHYSQIYQWSASSTSLFSCLYS